MIGVSLGGGLPSYVHKFGKKYQIFEYREMFFNVASKVFENRVGKKLEKFFQNVNKSVLETIQYLKNLQGEFTPPLKVRYSDFLLKKRDEILGEITIKDSHYGLRKSKSHGIGSRRIIRMIENTPYCISYVWLL
ncbi:MAG: hypothetical protein ACXAC2_11645, partial [Candidatus Kariarchaeaceae archaeon]